MDYPFISEKYKIISQIGNGRLGKSFLAVDNETFGLLVIKIFENETVWNIIDKNIVTLLQIDNVNITKIKSINRINLNKCIIQEYVYGDNLYDFIHSNDLHLGDFLFISYSLLNAVNYLNMLGLSHKDIKPGNIIYHKYKKICKLIDLDMCVLESQDKKYMGTLKYSAPEQILSYKPSIEADLYSVGLVLCFMIIGKIPFDKDLKAVNLLIKKKVISKLDDVFENNKNIGLDIAALINGLLEYNAEKRLTPPEALNTIKRIIKLCVNQKSESLLISDYKKLEKILLEDISTDVSFLNASFSMVVENTDQIPFSVPVIPLEFRSEIEVDVEENTEENSDDKMYTEDKKEQKETKSNSNIYRKQLLKEYSNILMQAKITFYLWVFSFAFCFCIIAISVFFVLNGHYLEGVITGVLDSTIMIIQKLFNIREDHYRELIEKKIEHLETGDYFDYAFSKAEKIEDLQMREKMKSELINEIRKQTKKHKSIKA